MSHIRPGRGERPEPVPIYFGGVRASELPALAEEERYRSPLYDVACEQSIRREVAAHRHARYTREQVLAALGYIDQPVLDREGRPVRRGDGRVSRRELTDATHYFDGERRPGEPINEGEALYRVMADSTVFRGLAHGGRHLTRADVDKWFDGQDELSLTEIQTYGLRYAKQLAVARREAAVRTASASSYRPFNLFDPSTWFQSAGRQNQVPDWSPFRETV